MSVTVLTAADVCASILHNVSLPRADAFVPEQQRPDVRFGRFSANGTPRISPSQVNTLRMCPARWRHQYLEGQASPGSYQSVVGTIGHAAMEAALTTCDDPIGPQALRDATETAARVHLSQPSTLAAMSNGAGADINRLSSSIGDAVQATWNWLLHHDVEVLAIEEKLVGKYYREIDVDSLSFVDARLRIDGRERVVDWKFPGRAPWRTGGEVEARESYQLAMQMYADAYRGVGIEVTDAWIVHAPLDGSDVAVAKQPISAGSMLASRGTVHDAIEVILAGELKPDPVTPGALCSSTWCPFYAACPATA
jgi:hypothetical protein